MSLYYNKVWSENGKAPSPRATVRRRAGRARYDREAINPILDEGLVGHVAFSVDDQPYAIPMLYARHEDELYLHGSPLSRLIGETANGLKICLTVTLIDGLVLARSAFHHSVNYRSVVAFGYGRPIRDRELKREALLALVERVVPGRSHDVRGPSESELDATEVLSLEIDEASAKIRSGPPLDASADYAIETWAGELPLRLAAGKPVPDSRCVLPAPDYVDNYARPHG